jgi:allantoicase
VVDTAHFKGNYPDSCSLESIDAPGTQLDPTTAQSLDWQEVLPKTKLRANHRHVFATIPNSPTATHVRFQTYPDGGVSRLRILGQPEIPPNRAETLQRLNLLPRAQFNKLMMDSCGSRNWAARLADARPFPTEAALFAHADRVWSELSQNDQLEAFHHHPPIGGNRASAKQSSAASRWSAKEQSIAQKAAPEVLSALAAANRAYAEKFGFVFLICATGKTSEEILQSLRQRMPNDPETEMRISAEEQQKITRLRLEKLLSS